MTSTPRVLRSAAVVAVALAAAAAAAVPMSKDEYRAVRSRIEAEYRDAIAACDRYTSNARDICRVEAKGKERIARAELEYNLSGTPTDKSRVAMASADAAYDVARERCENWVGPDRAVCVQEAKSKHAKAEADAKLERTVAEAKREAEENRRDAEYYLARKQCEVLVGDAKPQCLAAARAKFGKT
jgi:uncharacterized membrane protein YqiK